MHYARALVCAAQGVVHAGGGYQLALCGFRTKALTADCHATAKRNTVIVLEDVIPQGAGVAVAATAIASAALNFSN